MAQKRTTEPGASIAASVGAAAGAGNAAAVAEVQMRTYFSPHHLWAAERFSQLARDIENAHTDKPKFDIKHRAYVVNAVLSAVAFLEASINEVFDDAADEHTGYVDPLTADCRRLMAGVWDKHERYNVERWPLLDKYRMALFCSSNPAFDKGCQPYQDARLLINLRNVLAHARALTRATGSMDKFEKALSVKFKPSRLMENSANPYFPDHCLGAGCADWAVKAATAFADEFFNRLKIKPNYQRVNFSAKLAPV